MQASLGHISVLVVVLNAIGLGTLMIGIATVLRKPPRAGVRISGFLIAWLAMHLYVHVMLWWRFYGVQLSESFNFFAYLFMLSGPMALLFGSALLMPDEEEDRIDMEDHFERVRGRFFAFEAYFWGWALMFAPVVAGRWGAAWPIWLAMAILSLAMMLTPSRRVSLVLTATAWGIQVIFMSTLALQVGTAAPAG